MGPLEIHEKLQRERKRINDKLNASAKLGGDYAQAYGELSELTLWASLEIGRCDPSFGLTVLTYDDVIAREA